MAEIRWTGEAETTAKTLMEDWQDRRRYLESLESEHPRHRVQIRLLDYLIARHQGAAVADQPARFALQGRLHWNDRRITVHHHLGRGQVAGVRNREVAEERMARMLRHMRSDERSTDDPCVDEGFIRPQVSDSARRPLRWASLTWRIKLGWNADRQIRRLLNEHPVLSETCLRHLLARLSDPTRDDTIALEFLLKGRNQNILNWLMRAWRERVSRGDSTGRITAALEDEFESANHRTTAAELIRERLADDAPAVRVAAARLLSRLGDLDDIGLLSDLLSLPPSSDEAPLEREAIIKSMRTIAERNDS